MENKISFNELVNLNKDYINTYNEYMYYLKNMFRTTFKNIERIDLFANDKSIVLEIEYLKDNKISYFDIYKDLNEDNKSYNSISINGETSEELSTQILSKYRYIFNDLIRFYNDNDFMKRTFIKFENSNKEYTINILTDSITYEYKDKKTESNISITYDEIYSKRKNNSNSNKFIYDSKSYTINKINGMNNTEIKNILEEKMIDKCCLPGYVLNKNEKQKKLVK